MYAWLVTTDSSAVEIVDDRDAVEDEPVDTLLIVVTGDLLDVVDEINEVKALEDNSDGEVADVARTSKFDVDEGGFNRVLLESTLLAEVKMEDSENEEMLVADGVLDELLGFGIG